MIQDNDKNGPTQKIFETLKDSYLSHKTPETTFKYERFKRMQNAFHETERVKEIQALRKVMQGMNSKEKEKVLD